MNCWLVSFAYFSIFINSVLSIFIDSSLISFLETRFGCFGVFTTIFISDESINFPLSTKYFHSSRFQFKMRGTSVLLGKYHRPKYCFTDKEHEVAFKTRKPMKLDNSVSKGNTRSSSSQCIQEMFNMMACLKNNEFEQANCSKEIKLFNECNGSQRTVEYRMISKTDQRKLIAQPGQSNLSTVQLNDFLKKYPT